MCVYVCHRDHCEGLSRCRLVGQLCASWRRFLYIGLHEKPRLHAWHSHRQSRSHFAFSSLSDQWEIRLFSHFSKVIIFDGWAQRKRRKFYFSYQTSMEKNFSLPTQLEKFFWAIYHRACAVFRHSWFSHLHGPSSFFPWNIFPTRPSRSGVAPDEYWSFG